jgi:hypothetical protein
MCRCAGFRCRRRPTGERTAGVGSGVPQSADSSDYHQRQASFLFGFDVHVRVKNKGRTPVQLAIVDNRNNKPTLHSLLIEQLKSGAGWELVGGARDIPPASTVTLRHGGVIKNTVRLSLRLSPHQKLFFPDLKPAVPARMIRARLSVSQLQSEVVSKAVRLPPLNSRR